MLWGRGTMKKNNFTIVEGTLYLKTGLHIGSGEMSYLTDATVMKDTFGKPIIPGSSLKGVLRTAAERLHHLVLNKNLPKKVCFLAKEDCNQNESLRNELEPFIKEGNESEVNRLIEKKVCPICQLFGSTFRASKLSIYDCHLVNGTEDMTKVRHSVRIDRDTGAAKDGAKYDYEVVHPGTVFTFKIEAENLNKQDELLLYLALNELRSGHIQLGGKISRGLGSVLLENAKVINYDFSNQEDCRKYLKSVVRGKHEISYPLEEKLDILFQSY